MTVAQNRFTSDGAYRMSQRIAVLDTTFRGNTTPPGHSHGYVTASGGSIADSSSPIGLLLSVTDASGSRALLQSHEAGRAGRGVQCIEHPSATPANQIRRWGRFDSLTGAFFESRSTGLAAVVRNTPDGDVSYPAIAWNVDRADGTGDLPLVDLEDLHKYAVEIPETGAGLIRFFIDDILVHTVDTRTETGLESTVLPLASEVVNDGSAAAGSMRIVSAAIVLDDEPHVDTFAIAIASDTVPSGTGRSIAIRPKILTPVNRVIGLPRALSLFASGGAVTGRVCLGYTSGSAYTATFPGSLFEQYDGVEDLSAAASVFSEFEIQDGGSVSLDLAALRMRLRTVESFGGSAGILPIQLLVILVGTGVETVRGALAWDEIQP